MMAQGIDSYGLMLPKWIRADRYAEISGISEEAQKQKRKSGAWVRDREWKKGPDGRVYVNPRKIDEWIDKYSC